MAERPTQELHYIILVSFSQRREDWQREDSRRDVLGCFKIVAVMLEPLERGQGVKRFVVHLHKYPVTVQVVVNGVSLLFVPKEDRKEMISVQVPRGRFRWKADRVVRQ